eukprot:jgi/Chrpa1/5817/Chrysochromulina_OHIO_Genome00018252-RA
MGVPSAVAGALLSVQPAVLPLPLSSGLTFYSENPFVSHALLARRWRELAAPSRECSLIWTVKTTDVDFKTLSRGQLCNHFERCALTTKVGLLECLHDETRRPAATVTGSATGHGVSAVARLVLEQLRSSTAQMCFEALDGRRNVWVLKPSYGSKGVGVRLLNGDEGLSAVLGERDSRRVVQKYVERPLLIGGYKFDIRCWVLVTEWSPQLRAWFYDDDVLLRFCSDAFDLDELHNRFGHITNRTVQQERCAERSRPGTALSSSFEIFGLDMVLDETLRPWLIEVNEAPNLSAHGSALKELILQPMLSAAVELVVEPEHRRAPPERVGGWHRL